MKRLPDRRTAGAPPVSRILLRPAGPRTGEWLVLLRSGGDDLSGLIDDEGPRAARADVDTQISDFFLLESDPSPTWLSEVFRQIARAFPAVGLFFRFLTFIAN